MVSHAFLPVLRGARKPMTAVFTDLSSLFYLLRAFWTCFLIRRHNDPPVAM